MSWIVKLSLLQCVVSTVWFKDLVLQPSLVCDLTPPGHLLPFGYHKQPISDMDVIPNTINASEFNEIYIQQDAGYRPGIFRGLQSAARCTRHWDIFSFKLINLNTIY